ncbi:ABC transporter substrate-binding protein [Bacillus sp. AK031]
MKKCRNTYCITSSFRERTILMIILEHYLRLYIALETENREGVCEVSLSSISEVLYCTARNSKMTIGKWEKEGWVKWSPGRGRGNKSRLTFLRDPVELLFDECKRLVKNGKLEAAQLLVTEYGIHFTELESTFGRWIDTMFGYKAENRNNKQRDILRMKFGKQPFAPLDPARVSLRSECHIVKQVCDTLIYFNEETRTYEPRLAFYWEHNRAGDEWTFYLRKGVRFHDGSIMTAHDIQYTFERFLKHEESHFKWMLSDLKESRIIDDHCVTLIFDKPNFLLPDILSDEHLSIISCSRKAEFYKDHLTGTGPFRLKRNDGTMLVLEANENYFRERPFLDEVEIWNVPEGADRSPGITEVEFGYSTGKQEGDSGRQKQKRMEKNVQFLSLNSKKKGPMSDRHLRKAIRMAANPSLIVKELGEFRQEAASSFLQPGMDFEKGEPSEWLARSTYNGEELHLYSFQDRDHVEDASWLKERCSKFGIHITNHFVPADVFLKKETLEMADLIHDSATLTEQEELSFLQLLLAGNSPIYNHLGEELKGTVLDKVDCLKGIPDKSVRMDILEYIERLLTDTCVAVPLYKNLSELKSDEIIQQALINSQGWIDFYRIWFKRN